ncbi:MAG TPA: TRCF domain-containing protein, partial [Chitinophagaceae bacterium]|nr:TRCF domain-containing protein [Chitinophagaceae bacterium]
LEDRFGALPQQVNDLFITVRCRKLAVDLGFEKMSLKEETFRGFFINRPDSPYFESGTFSRLIEFLQTGTNKAKLKQTGKLFMLIAANMKRMEEMHRFLQAMHAYCFPSAATPA